MFSRGKQYNEVAKEIKDPPTLYLLEVGKQASDVGVNVGQDIFSLKYIFESCSRCLIS